MGSLIGALDFTRDGLRLAAATWGGVEIIDVTSGRTLSSFPTPEEKREECSAIFAPDGSALYTGNVVRGMRRHRPAAGGAFDEGELLDPEKNWLLADITLDGTQLLLVNREHGKVKISDSNGGLVKPFNKHPNAMFTALSPDRKWIATQSMGRGEAAEIGARVWSLADETLAKEFATGPLGFVTFSADGRWFAAAGLKGFQLVRAGDWTTPHNGLPAKLANSDGAVVSFAGDGELVAATVVDKVYLVHPASGAERGIIASPSGNTSTARARLDAAGRRLAVMWDDGSFDLWDLAALREELSGLGIAF
jgi:WD40 repeat protein